MATERFLPVSIIVPARDEGRTIDALLRSLLDQHPTPSEVVVVDAGSSDDTMERVRRWAAHAPLVRLLSIGPAFPGQARNAGIAAAANDWVALVDAGTRAGDDWLAALWAGHEREPDATVVFGHYEPVLTGWYTECATLTYVAPCVALEGRWWRGDSFASALLSREAWRRCGGFPPYRAAEDLMFLEALAAHGCRVAAAPAARVTWQIPAGPIGTFRRFALYSRHNLIAGRGRFWHRGVARQYACAAAVGIAGAVLSPALWALLPAAALARAARAVGRRCGGSGVQQPWRPDRLAGVMMIQGTLDMATLWGTLAWLYQDVLSAGGTR